MNSQLNLTSDDQLHAAAEALLFVYGEKVAFTTLANVLSVNKEKAEEIVHNLQQSMREHNRGLRLIISDTSAQLVTAPELAPLLQEIVIRSKRIWPATSC